MVGNFIADTVRGSHLEKYPEDIRLGITVHRAIDTYTDAHPLVLQTRELLYAHFGKYAGVVQDVFYDHFLAVNWSLYAKEPLYHFVNESYRVLESNREWMNVRALRTLTYMHAQDWLGNYAKPEGVDRSLKGLSHRAKFDSHMEDSMPAFHSHYKAMNEHFQLFFPQLEMFIRQTYGNEIKASQPD